MQEIKKEEYTSKTVKEDIIEFLETREFNLSDVLAFYFGKVILLENKGYVINIPDVFNKQTILNSLNTIRKAD